MEKFLELGHQVVILDDLSTGRRENLPAGADFIEGDITDTNLVPGIFEQYKFEVVNYHAAQMDVRRSVDDPAFDAGSTFSVRST